MHSSSSHQHDAVLLQVVPFTGNIGCDDSSIGELDSCDFAHGRVGLLGLCCEDLNKSQLAPPSGFDQMSMGL